MGEILGLHSTRGSRRSKGLRCHGRGHARLDKSQCGPLKKEKMQATPSCPDCVGLVGAPPMREPHSGLLPLPKDSEGRDQFRCATCGYLWSIGPLGWSSFVGQLLADFCRGALCRPFEGVGMNCAREKWPRRQPSVCLRKWSNHAAACTLATSVIALPP